MAIYSKHGECISNQSARLDPGCYFADKVIKIRAIPDNRKKEQVFWVKDLLADGGRPEIETFITGLRRPAS